MGRAQPISIVLSCEHAGNSLPAEFRPLFSRHKKLLESHRGWDPGALAIARAFSRTLDVSLTATNVTRLLIEPNRSPHHPALFSPVTRPLDAPTRRRIIDRYYTPHRTAVRDRVRAHADLGDFVLHIGVHTFTPSLNGIRRNADVGLLYDPSRPSERLWCLEWARQMRSIDPHLRVRRNYPYRGASDGLTTSLRREFAPDEYMGIELEVNQALAASPDGHVRRQITRTVVRSLTRMLGPHTPRVHPLDF